MSCVSRDKILPIFIDLLQIAWKSKEIVFIPVLRLIGSLDIVIVVMAMSDWLLLKPINFPFKWCYGT